MVKKLFVSGLTAKATESNLSLLFSRVGTVESSEIIVDKASGVMQDFGFVVMSSEQEANEAILLLDGILFNGRSITVYPARPRIVRNPPVPVQADDRLPAIKE